MALRATSQRPRKICAICMTFLLCVYAVLYFRVSDEHIVHVKQLRNDLFDITTRNGTDVVDIDSKNENITTEKRWRFADRQTIRHLKNLTTLMPLCDNILQNITKGRWIRKIELPGYRSQTGRWQNKELDLENELKEFWVKRGIQMAFWRPDDRCGYKNYEQKPPNSTWPLVGSWCNAKGEKPCCSNANDGLCMEPSKGFCDCRSCVDLRKYVYADVSEWIVDDPRCHWRNYSASEACDVIDRSPFFDLHFVGDSFMRNMFRTFAMLITADTVHGAMNKSTPMHERQLCTEMQQFFWKECRETLYNVSETLHTGKLCDGRGSTSFTATMKPYYNNRYKDRFLELVKSKLGKNGSLIILSIGFHMGCKSENEISNYLGPAVEAIENYYRGAPRPIVPQKLSGRWPQLILSLPLTIGLLKPPRFLSAQNQFKCSKYSSEMMEYAKLHDVRVMDFRPLTTLVHSFDGTHHGIGVNMIKNQILLNFIASIK